MPAKSHGERLDRLEEVLTEFIVETRRGFDQVAAQFREVAAFMRETDERMRKTDERIDRLAVAIGEFVRRNPTPPTSQ